MAVMFGLQILRARYPNQKDFFETSDDRQPGKDPLSDCNSKLFQQKKAVSFETASPSNLTRLLEDDLAAELEHTA
jgi:hypothetical protein